MLRSVVPLLPCLFLVLWVSPLVAEEDAPEPEKEKGYADVVPEDARTDEGLFRVHRVEEKLLFEIPHELLGRDMLLVSRIPSVPAGLWRGAVAAGHKAGEQVVRWERHEDRVLLRRFSYRSVADEDDPVYRSVRNNNFAPILAAFDIEIEGPAPAEGDSTGELTPKTTVVVDVTDLYTTDVPALSPLPASIREAYKVKGVDKDRSFLEYARSYPQNVEVRTTFTFKASEPPVDADTETLSLQAHQSMILLPEEPMRRRFADHRVGWFTVERSNLSLDAQKTAREEFLQRWRLEPKDPKAYARGRLVEPVKPIVFYLDPATPEKWKPWVKKGVEDWQGPFESAGFKNAILALDPPDPEDDPEWNGEDVRYSIVRWAANDFRNAMGPSVADPRSGEIIEADIVWYHNHMRTYRNRLMIETGAANPLARSLPIDDDLMGEAMRQVIAHEVGHALGLPHNMIASAAYPVESLRDRDFVRENGITATIMEYGRQNYVAQPGDGLEGADFIRQIGPYDHYAINWGYRVLDVDTPEDEREILDDWILEKAGDPVYRFGPQRAGLPIDPRIQTEDLGDDAVAATRYAVANLQRVVPNLVEWTAQPGEDYDDLEEIYGDLFWQYTRYCRHVVSVVGGVHQVLKATDEDGAVYQPVDGDYQRRALAFLSEHVFATPDWLLDEDILVRIQSAGSVERLRRLQTRVLHDLLDPGRLQRLTEDDAYPLAAFLDDLKVAIWDDAAAPDPHRRALQRTHLERLHWLMTEDPPLPTSSWVQFTPVDVVTSDIRPLVRAQLRDLMDETDAAGWASDDALLRAHYLDAHDRIEGYLDVD